MIIQITDEAGTLFAADASSIDYVVVDPVKNTCKVTFKSGEFVTLAGVSADLRNTFVALWSKHNRKSWW